MAEKQDKQDEKATGTVTKNVEVETTVDDPQAPREDTVARERSTSPVPRVGDTWESMDPRNEEEKGPQRRIGVLSRSTGIRCTWRTSRRAGSRISRSTVSSRLTGVSSA
jgi:hypothetical protein